MKVRALSSVVHDGKRYETGDVTDSQARRLLTVGAAEAQAEPKAKTDEKRSKAK